MTKSQLKLYKDKNIYDNQIRWSAQNLVMGMNTIFSEDEKVELGMLLYVTGVK